MAASIDNIFGDAAPAAATPASKGPSLDNIFGEQAKSAPTGPSIDSIFHTPSLLKQGESAFPDSVKAPVKFAMPDTSNLFQKSVGMLDTSMSNIGKSTPALPPTGAAPTKTTAPKGVGSEFADYKNPFAAPLASIGVTVPTSIAEPGSNLESVIKAGKAAGDQLRSSIQKPIATTFNFTAQQAQSLMPQDDAFKNGSRNLNYGDLANLVPKLFVQSGLPNAALDIAEPIESKLTGQTGGAVKFPSFNNDPIQAQGVETDYEQRLAAGQTDKQAFWGSTLNLGLDLSVLIPLARGLAKVGVKSLTPDALLETMKFNTKDLRTFLQTGEPMPKDLQEAFLKLPDKQKADLAKGLITEIKNPTPSLLGKILGVSEEEAKDIFHRTGTPILPAPLKQLPSGKFEDVLKDEIKTALTQHPEPVVSQALQEQHGIPAHYADQAIRIAKGDKTPAEAKALQDKLLGDVLAKRSDEQISKDTEIFVNKNLPTLVDSYIKQHANYVGADEAKELIPGYPQDRSTSDLVQKSAGKVSEAVYDKLLDSRKGKGNDVVLITGGATGAGKSTLLRGGGGFDYKDFAVVLDSNLSNGPSAITRIKKALEKGYKVHIAFVSTPVREAYARVLGRAEQMTNEKGSARPVSAQGHIDMHHGSADAMLEILEAFKDESRVHIDIFNNAGKEPTLISDNLAFIQEISHNKDNATALHKELNDQRLASHGEGKISDKTNAAFERAEKLRPKKDQPAAAELPQSGNKEQESNVLTRVRAQPRGMVAPGAIAEDIAAAATQIKETLDKIEQTRELTGDVREGIYQHENKRKANRERLAQMLERVGDLLDSKGWTELYHYDENKDEALTQEQQEVYDQIILPLKSALTDTIAEYKELGGTITSELFFVQDGSDYTPRFAKDKGGAIDKLLEKGKDLKRSIANGGLLSKSLGSVDKSRKFFAATDENGKRTVVHVPTDKSQDVLAFKNGSIENLGPVKGSRTPKIKEFFDPKIRSVLEKIIKDIGYTHTRVITGKSRGLGPNTVGVTLPGEKAIKTRMSPDSTLAHEAGHAIARKYDYTKWLLNQRYGTEHDAILREEMRALADARFEGSNAPESFKKYVRKASEKEAVQFEAFVANPEMFQEIAPHLFDDFRDFLATIPEVKPLLNIEGSLLTGSEVHGGKQSGKIGKTFVDKTGKKYTIGQATTKEIEANTKTRYHKNVLANYVVALDRAQNALNAMKLLERIKDEKVFGEIIKKDNPDESAPEGWKTVGDVLPQFRGYHMEPRLAEALTDLGNRQKGGMHIPIFDEVNNLLITAIVINPIMHIPNVLAGRGLAAATGSMSPKSFANLKKAYTEVRNKGPLYLDYLEHGAPFMALKETTKKFTDAILNQYTDELENDPDAKDLAKMLGFKSVAAFGKGFMHINEAITWGSNDIFFMHALMDYGDAHKVTMEEAIREVSKRMGDYRIPERVLLPGQAGRALSIASQSRALMFARYHYSGTIKPWLEAMKETAGPGSTGKQRLDGMRAFAYLFIMGLLVYPYLNKLWQGVTGSSTTYMSMAGPIKQIQVAEKLRENGVQGLPTALQGEFTPSPAIRSAMELGFNVNLFDRNPIYGPLPAEGLSAYGSSVISPLASASRMNPTDFALALFGIWTPKNVGSKNVLNQMRYDEKPALQADVKKDIVSGNQEEADQKMAEFNSRVIATWNQYQLETNGTQFVNTDEEKQAFLKEWGVKEPGAKALTNAAALYADGSLTSKSSLTDTVATYAKAIGVDPVTAFERIFTGQRILRVSHFGLFNADSSIIVERMPLADSEAVKTERGAAAGMVLDHVIPLEAGGSNDKSNLNLIEDAQNKGEQHTFENFLGQATKDGMISRAKVREYSIRYKVGQGETLPDAYMQEFKDKYNSQPMTLQEVEDAVNKGQAK